MADVVRSLPSIMDRRLAPAAPTGLREFLSFRLGADVYAVELARIREIVSPPPLTEVPRAQPDVMGICSVRGLLVTVVDLRRRLNLEESPTTRLSRILLANTDSGEVIGLLVDEVRHVVRLASAEIEITANVLGGDLSDHVLGVGRPDGDFLVLLDLASMVET
jgi:purine-binding chemotaxis protein CheW